MSFERMQFMDLIELFLFFSFAAFHNHLNPVTVAPQAHRAWHRGQAKPRGVQLRGPVTERQGPAGAWRGQLPAGGAEEPDEGAADDCGAAQGPANVMKLTVDESRVWTCQLAKQKWENINARIQAYSSVLLHPAEIAFICWGWKWCDRTSQLALGPRFPVDLRVLQSVWFNHHVQFCQAFTWPPAIYQPIFSHISHHIKAGYLILLYLIVSYCQAVALYMVIVAVWRMKSSA